MSLDPWFAEVQALVDRARDVDRDELALRHMPRALRIIARLRETLGIIARGEPIPSYGQPQCFERTARMIWTTQALAYDGTESPQPSVGVGEEGAVPDGYILEDLDALPVGNQSWSAEARRFVELPAEQPREAPPKPLADLRDKPTWDAADHDRALRAIADWWEWWRGFR